MINILCEDFIWRTNFPFFLHLSFVYFVLIFMVWRNYIFLLQTMTLVLTTKQDSLPYVTNTDLLMRETRRKFRHKVDLLPSLSVTFLPREASPRQIDRKHVLSWSLRVSTKPSILYFSLNRLNLLFPLNNK